MRQRGPRLGSLKAAIDTAQADLPLLLAAQEGLPRGEEQGIAILGTDVARSEELRQVESLAASQVRSLVCVPLTVFQRVIGCIYLDSESVDDRLQEEHLQMVTAIAGISAVALENARRLRWLEEENQRLTVEISQDRSLVGEGARMKEIYQLLKRAAPAEYPSPVAWRSSR